MDALNYPSKIFGLLLMPRIKLFLESNFSLDRFIVGAADN
jgi:hypothetical protein